MRLNLASLSGPTQVSGKKGWSGAKCGPEQNRRSSWSYAVRKSTYHNSILADEERTCDADPSLRSGWRQRGSDASL